MESVFNQKEPKTEAAASPAAKVIKTVVLVDDSDDDELFLRRAMTQAGITSQLVRLPGGRQALEYFSRTGEYADTVKYPDSDLVFLDIKMPSVSGFDVLSWLQAHPSVDAPLVVVLSSSDALRDQVQAKELGAKGYRSKPTQGDFFTELAAELGLQWAKR